MKHNKQTAREEYFSFMVEYVAFLGEMRQAESEKLKALTAKKQRLIEQSISKSQANAKQLENFESKRLELQTAAGYEGLSFRQLIEKTPEEEQSGFWSLFTRFEGTIADIRFFNNKSMAVARDNILEINPSAIIPGSQAGNPENPYERFRKEQSEQSQMLETKA